MVVECQATARDALFEQARCSGRAFDKSISTTIGWPYGRGLMAISARWFMPRLFFVVPTVRDLA